MLDEAIRQVEEMRAVCDDAGMDVRLQRLHATLLEADSRSMSEAVEFDVDEFVEASAEDLHEAFEDFEGVEDEDGEPREGISTPPEDGWL